MERKPKIGIPLIVRDDSLEDLVLSRCADAVEKFGGVPYALFLCQDTMGDYIDEIDGLLLPGGKNLHPSNYCEKRLYPSDEYANVTQIDFEMKMVNWALKEDRPILGVCLGMQLLNVVFGGTLYQDIDKQYRRKVSKEERLEKPAGPLNHQAKLINDQGKPITKFQHIIKIKQGTELSAIYRMNNSLWTNSCHMQAVKELGKGIIASAYACDGIIEAIEHTRHNFVIGVQWHPELLLNTCGSRLLFTHFLDRCLESREKREDSLYI